MKDFEIGAINIDSQVVFSYEKCVKIRVLADLVSRHPDFPKNTPVTYDVVKLVSRAGFEPATP
jgi:hypothetical protein